MPGTRFKRIPVAQLAIFAISFLALHRNVEAGISATAVQTTCEATLLPALALTEADVNCTTFPDELRPYCCGSVEAALTAHRSCVPPPFRNQGCEPGFFDFGDVGAYPCPSGGICPENTICFVSCPVGAYCEQSTTTGHGRTWKPWPVNNESVASPAASQDLITVGGRMIIGLNENTSCSPDYMQRLMYQTFDENGTSLGLQVRCGGSFNTQFFSACPGGCYCPNTTVKIGCPAGYFCRQGSTSPEPCPTLATCSAGSTDPTFPTASVVAVLIFFVAEMLVLALLSHRSLVQRMKERLFRRLGKVGPIDFNPPSRRNDWTTSGSQYGKGDGRKAFNISLEFSQVSLHLRSNGKTILKEVSGYLLPGTATAVIGESGSGKTSLLNALAGRAYYARQDGEVYINGELSNLNKYRDLVGFVPQEDIMQRDLTVREVLFYQALLRLSHKVTRDQAKKKVERTIDLLGKRVGKRRLFSNC